MGRGRPIAANAATSPTASSAPKMTARCPLSQSRSTEKLNEKDQHQPRSLLEDSQSDDSSQDSVARKTRRNLPATVSKDQSANAIIPNETANASNMRSRLRKSTQLVHSASLNLAESRVQKQYCSNNSTDELLVVSDGILMKSRLNDDISSNNVAAEAEYSDPVANDDNVIQIVEITDETDNLSLDTDTLTNESSSLMPDSNEATCSADDEAESSIFSDDSRTRSSSIIAVASNDSNSMSTVVIGKQIDSNSPTILSVASEVVVIEDSNSIGVVDRKIENNEEKSKMCVDNLVEIEKSTESNQPEAPNISPDHNKSIDSETKNQLPSSPEFFYIPKPANVRTYQNKRKLRADAAKKLEMEPAKPTVSQIELIPTVDTNNANTAEDQSSTSDRQEITECRRSQRQRVVKYEVRDLFNLKGSRNNMRPGIQSNKNVKDSPRSDISSSPQTFRGFSDTDDPSSPVQFANQSASRQGKVNSSPILAINDCEKIAKPNIIEKLNKASESPDEIKISTSSNAEVIPNPDKILANKSPVKDSTEQVKFVKNPSKKEAKKPLRILPRRKTVLLNRPIGEIQEQSNSPNTTIRARSYSVALESEIVKLVATPEQSLKLLEPCDSQARSNQSAQPREAELSQRNFSVQCNLEEGHKPEKIEAIISNSKTELIANRMEVIKEKHDIISSPQKDKIVKSSINNIVENNQEKMNECTQRCLSSSLICESMELPEQVHTEHDSMTPTTENSVKTENDRVQTSKKRGRPRKNQDKAFEVNLDLSTTSNDNITSQNQNSISPAAHLPIQKPKLRKSRTPNKNGNSESSSPNALQVANNKDGLNETSPDVNRSSVVPRDISDSSIVKPILPGFSQPDDVSAIKVMEPEIYSPENFVVNENISILEVHETKTIVTNDFSLVANSEGVYETGHQDELVNSLCKPTATKTSPGGKKIPEKKKTSPKRLKTKAEMKQIEDPINVLVNTEESKNDKTSGEKGAAPFKPKRKYTKREKKPECEIKKDDSLENLMKEIHTKDANDSFVKSNTKDSRIKGENKIQKPSTKITSNHFPDSERKTSKKLMDDSARKSTDLNQSQLVKNEKISKIVDSTETIRVPKKSQSKKNFLEDISMFTSSVTKAGTSECKKEKRKNSVKKFVKHYSLINNDLLAPPHVPTNASVERKELSEKNDAKISILSLIHNETVCIESQAKYMRDPSVISHETINQSAVNISECENKIDDVERSISNLHAETLSTPAELHCQDTHEHVFSNVITDNKSTDQGGKNCSPESSTLSKIVDNTEITQDNLSCVSHKTRVDVKDKINTKVIDKNVPAKNTLSKQGSEKRPKKSTNHPALSQATYKEKEEETPKKPRKKRSDLGTTRKKDGNTPNMKMSECSKKIADEQPPEKKDMSIEKDAKRHITSGNIIMIADNKSSKLKGPNEINFDQKHRVYSSSTTALCNKTIPICEAVKNVSHVNSEKAIEKPQTSKSRKNRSFTDVPVLQGNSEIDTKKQKSLSPAIEMKQNHDPNQRSIIKVNNQQTIDKVLKTETSSRKIIVKRRKERITSKSLSTSDGVSDNYSSDSNDSKQYNRSKPSRWDATSKIVRDSTCSEKPLIPRANLSSVLNGLSTDVMNDLLEWTCNNKQTVMQIRETIDSNQRLNSVLITGKDFPLPSTDQIKDDISEKLTHSSKDTSLDEIKIEDGERSKLAAAIQTSKDMLAELMNNSFGIDTDICSESSEPETKPSPPLELKKPSKPSDGETSTKSSDSDQTDQNSQDSSVNIRRSHRIKTQVKSTVVGRGLVRDKSDRNQNNTSALDLEAENVKFLKDMEERLSQFQMIKENEYRCERIISKEAKRMTCDCFLTRDEEDRGELGCGEDCLNRLLMIECSSNCNVGERCTNRRFQRNNYAPCKVFRTEKKGFGILADGEISSGEFIMEYVGEVLNGKQFEKRAGVYSLDKNKHYYFMALRGDSIIDATMKGNISRFINHSCDPNAETQKWTVNGELRIGFFSKRKIVPGEEITFDYQFQRYGKEAQKCYCESSNCRGWIGEEPDSEDEVDISSSESEEELESKLPDGEDKTSKELTPGLSNVEKLPDHLGVQRVENASEKQSTIEVDTTEGEPSTVSVEIATEKIVPVSKLTEKELEARRALRAAQKFARIAAKMKARNDRELMKQQTRLAMEDPDLEAQIVSLEKMGLKNQPLTLQLSRCMVRAKYLNCKLRILSILRQGEMACRRLFLDYHGLRLLHGWMSEIETTDIEKDLNFRQQTLVTLEQLPIPNKTILKDSKVFQVVESWASEMHRQISTNSSPDTEDTQQPPCKKQKTEYETKQDVRQSIRDLAQKLTSAWEDLPEVFRIPKRERIEQMKEHEREADRQYKALNLGDEDQYSKDLRNKERFGAKKSYKWSRDKYDKRKDLITKETEKINNAEANLTKLQRRQLFAAKVAKDEAEKRLAEIRREFEFKCKFYGLDPRHMSPNAMPFFVHPPTGQWYSKEKKKILTPPSHAHIKVPPKPQSTDPKDYKMPEMDLPPMWKFAMDPRGRLYYYHIKIRIPQWEPPIKILPLTRDALATDGLVTPVDGLSSLSAIATISSTNEPQPGTSKQALEADAAPCMTDESDDTESDISCSEIIGLKKGVPLKIGKEMIDELRRSRKRKRFSRLVQERTISPRREEDRLYNQIEMRKYRENKEKIRRRKDEIKRRKAQKKKEEENVANISSQPSTSAAPVDGDNTMVPIQDYLLSSDEDELEKLEYDKSLVEKFVHGDKIVDELDAIAKEKPLKRPIPFVKDHSELKKKIKLDEKKLTVDTSKSEKSNKSRESKTNQGKNASRRAREKFRSDIAGIIVHHLTPYRRDSCSTGKITNNDDFKHLARKLTHFVLLKELKHCDSTGQTLVVTESVKNKSREFIKKYMAKYGKVYIRPVNDPEFRDIPH